MPHYTFTWSDVVESTVVELDDNSSAWSEAVVSVSNVLRDIDGSMPDKGELRLHVMDEIGRFVGSVCVTAARS